MRQKTTICVQCHERPAQHGRYCNHCDYENHKGYHQERHRTRRIDWNKYGARRDRARALEAYGSACQDCGWSEVPEVLEVHHLDGDRKNNVLTNLRILCPTCHQVRHFREQTASWLPGRNGLVLKRGVKIPKN